MRDVSGDTQLTRPKNLGGDTFPRIDECKTGMREENSGNPGEDGESEHGECRERHPATLAAMSHLAALMLYDGQYDKALKLQKSQYGDTGRGRPTLGDNDEKYSIGRSVLTDFFPGEKSGNPVFLLVYTR